MLIVPRSREAVEGIGINALGYAGSLFVRDRAEMAAVERIGPLRLITQIAKDADIDPRRFAPRAIRNKISSLKNELVDDEARFVNRFGRSLSSAAAGESWRARPYVRFGAGRVGSS